MARGDKAELSRSGRTARVRLLTGREVQSHELLVPNKPSLASGQAAKFRQDGAHGGEGSKPTPSSCWRASLRPCAPTLSCCLLLAVIVLMIAFETNKDPNALLLCDRQCRWYLGFFDRSIQGARNGSKSCSCTRVDLAINASVYLGQVPLRTTTSPFLGPPTVPPTPFSTTACCIEGDKTPLRNCTPTGKCHANTYPEAKPFDPATWSNKYTTQWVCVLNTNSSDNHRAFNPTGTGTGTGTGTNDSHKRAVEDPLATIPRSIRLPPHVHAACTKELTDRAAVSQDLTEKVSSTFKELNPGSQASPCQEWKREQEARGLRVLHCGRCSACSSLQDLSILEATKRSITTDMTRCSTKFVLSQSLPLPFHSSIFRRQSVADLKNCLIGKGINFTDDGRAWRSPVNKPSCMDTWVDNILNDASICTPFCWSKFLHTANQGDFARDSCLQCDEYSSGPAFIKGAGANRRSAGIESDIDRTQLRGTAWEQKICPIGFYSPPAS